MSYSRLLRRSFFFFGQFWLFVLFKKIFIDSKAFPQNDLKREKKNKKEDENGNENEAAKEA